MKENFCTWFRALFGSWSVGKTKKSESVLKNRNKSCMNVNAISVTDTKLIVLDKSKSLFFSVLFCFVREILFYVISVSGVKSFWSKITEMFWGGISNWSVAAKGYRLCKKDKLSWGGDSQQWWGGVVALHIKNNRSAWSSACKWKRSQLRVDGLGLLSASQPSELREVCEFDIAVVNFHGSVLSLDSISNHISWTVQWSFGFHGCPSQAFLALAPHGWSTGH